MIDVVYIEDETASLDPSTVYRVLEVEAIVGNVPFYRIKDSMGDIAYYPASWFVVVDGFEEAATAGIPESWMQVRS